MSELATEILAKLPEPLRDGVGRYWTQMAASAERAGVTLSLNDELTAFLAKVWACSPFVAQSCALHPVMLKDLVESGDLLSAYDPACYSRRLELAVANSFDDLSLGIELRRFRRREMVRIAWRDMAGWAPLDETLTELSALASACVDVALNRVHGWMCDEFGVPHGVESAAPQQMVVLGMGKLGADELNFSSDIDLIYAYAEEGKTQGGRRELDNQEFFLRLGRRLVAVISQQTAEGYVFRVDLRLRPFGDAGPLAMGFDAMEEYYQVHGREWERYALIKAAVIAGDREAGDELLKSLRPFVYRRYLDFGAFESLREMKGMISEQVRRKGMENNVKLGAGGIREVEFIGQAYQLIRGGREPELQVRPIRQVLGFLGRQDYLPRYVTDALDEAYVFLRRAENRIQAMQDQQTHILPENDVDRQRLAFAMGYDAWPAFEAELRRHMNIVHGHFEQVFAAPQAETAAAQESAMERLWKHSVADDRARELLAAEGFDDVVEAQRLLVRLHDGRLYKNLPPQGRTRLDRLMPLLLGAVAAVAGPTATLARLISLIEAIARRSAYLALLVENPLALSQLVKLCAASPWIATHLARYPLLLDELLDPRSLYVPLDRAALEAELDLALARVGDDLEQQMNALRHFKQANVLRVAAADVSGVYPLMVVSDHLTEIAEVELAATLRLAYAQVGAKHGRPMCDIVSKECEPGFIIIGYGKLGGIELGYGSDLDVVFLQGDEGLNQSTDGESSIANNVFFNRLGQRIIHLMTTMTPAGVLYDVDTRLRPSGEAGMLVSPIDAFERYQNDEAWTWEHQALVRARVVAGDPVLARRFEAVRRKVLGRPRDGEKLRIEVREMRERMRSELSKARSGQFDLKQDSGGIADIEFMVQYLALRWAHDHPALLRWTDNIRLLETLAAEGLMVQADADVLADAYRAYRAAGHHRVLQDQNAVVDEVQFEQMRDQVARIWRDLMETVK